MCRRELRPLVGKRPLVNVQLQIPVLHACGWLFQSGCLVGKDGIDEF